MIVTLLALLACVQPTGDFGAATFSINKRVPTVINAGWTSAEGGEAYVEWGYDDRLIQRSQPADEIRPGHQADDQRRQRGHHRAEGQVLKDPQEPELGSQALQPQGQAKQHERPLMSVYWLRCQGLSLIHI